MMTIARAYDAIAHEYDAHLAGDPVAGYMRTRLHAHMRRLFHPGDHVLDLSAGTGVDACHLAALGVQVTAIDTSQRMIAELKSMAVRRGVQVDAHVLPAERLDTLDVRDLDGAISTFAGLNTMDNLPRLARNLAERLRPHGRVLIHALNAFCFWKWVAAHCHSERSEESRSEESRSEESRSEESRPCGTETLRLPQLGWGAQGDRLTHVSIGRQIVPHRVYDPFALAHAAFADYFDVRRVYGLSVVAGLPLVKRFSSAARLLFAIDQIAGQVFPTAGDFFVVELERRDAQRRNTPCI